jgi:hypothetical protein
MNWSPSITEIGFFSRERFRQEVDLILFEHGEKLDAIAPRPPLRFFGCYEYFGYQSSIFSEQIRHRLRSLIRSVNSNRFSARCSVRYSASIYDDLFPRAPRHAGAVRSRLLAIRHWWSDRDCDRGFIIGRGFPMKRLYIGLVYWRTGEMGYSLLNSNDKEYFRDYVERYRKHDPAKYTPAYIVFVYLKPGIVL